MTTSPRLHLPTGLSRRRFLGGTGALGLGLLTGCSTAGGFRTEDLGGGSQLTILNWADYVDPTEADQPGTVDRFTADTGIGVVYEEGWEDNAAAWNDLIEPTLSSGGVLAADIIVPTNWLAARMIERGWAEPIPLEVIPNHVNIQPSYLTNDWDRGSRFQMPWQGGITGIAYDPAQTNGPVTSIEDLFSDRMNGRVGLIVEMRETVGFGMLLNGDDPSRPTFDTASAGLRRIAQEVGAGKVAMFTANEFADELAAGNLAAAMAWSGDTVLLQADRPDIEFVVPAEGAISWFDTMVIPKGSPNKAAAAAWMNYVYEPANAAAITNWVGYLSPVIGVGAALRDIGATEVATNPILFPDDETQRRLFTWGGLDSGEEEALEEEFAVLIG